MKRFAYSGFILVPCIALLFFSLRLCTHLINDREMVDYFQVHTTDFDTLAEMLASDQKVFAINDDKILVSDPRFPKSSYLWVTPAEVDFPLQRFNEYHRLLDNIHGVFYRSNEGDLIFGTGGHGFASYGARWGYVLCKNAPDKEWVIDSIDHHQPTPLGKEAKYYRNIKANWYGFLAY